MSARLGIKLGGIRKYRKKQAVERKDQNLLIAVHIIQLEKLFARNF